MLPLPPLPENINQQNNYQSTPQILPKNYSMIQQTSLLTSQNQQIHQNICFDNNVPIYIQLVEQLKISIISGVFNPGDRLPSVRELAMNTKVNPNTMQRALAELENLGLVYTERTSGRFVTKDGELIDNIKKEYALEIAKKFFLDMEGVGFNKEEAIEYLSKLGGNK